MLVGNNKSATTKNAGKLLAISIAMWMVGNNKSAITKNAGNSLVISIAMQM